MKRVVSLSFQRETTRFIVQIWFHFILGSTSNGHM